MVLYQKHALILLLRQLWNP